MFRLKRSFGTICHRRLIPYHLKRSISTEHRGKTYFVPSKTFSRNKTRTNCRPHLPTHQDNHTGNRHPSTTASLTSVTRTCTPIHNRIPDLSYTAMYTPSARPNDKRNGSTDMDTVPRKIGIQRIIRADPPRLSEKSSRD